VEAFAGSMAQQSLKSTTWSPSNSIRGRGRWPLWIGICARGAARPRDLPAGMVDRVESRERPSDVAELPHASYPTYGMCRGQHCSNEVKQSTRLKM
jgi:hypothetical protein